MKTYARMVDGQIVEIIPPFIVSEDVYVSSEILDEKGEPTQVLLHAAGTEVPIADRFTPEIVAQLVEYDPRISAPQE